MYLAISVGTTFAALAMLVCEFRRTERLRRALRTKIAEAESFERTSKSMEGRWETEKNLRRASADQCHRLRKALQESEDVTCRLRQELQAARQGEELTQSEHDEAIKRLTEAEKQVAALKYERRKLEEKLIAERESAEHWKEECDRQAVGRLTAEGRIYREIANILSYDGTAAGQEDVNE